MCHNIQKREDQPLALQQLMLKHVRSLLGVPVRYVGENEISHLQSGSQEAKDRYVEKLFDNFNS